MNAPLTTIHWSALSHVGRFRKNNEDAFLGLCFNSSDLQYLGKIGESPLSSHDFVFAVSDGMGGAKSGEFASKIAIEKITKLLPKSFTLTANSIANSQNDILEELIHQIHNSINDLGRYYEECRGMGATMSLAWITPTALHFAHIGDSRIYYLPKDGEMIQITHDHSYVGWLVRSGQINEREARTHPRKSALNQSLGGGAESITPQTGSVTYQSGDRFLICSDGVVDGLWNRRLEEFLSQETLNAEQLVLEAVEASGRDNTTAILLEIQ